MPCELDAFVENFKNGQTQLVYEWHVADLETPVSTYMKLTGGETINSFLLESVEGGAVLGRYSAIGLDPDLIWQCKNGKSFLKERPADDWKEEAGIAPLTALRALMQHCKIDSVDSDIPPMGASGLFGYMGYDMIRLIEDIPDTNPDPLNIPDSYMIRPRLMVIFDNIKHMMCFVAPVYEHAHNTNVSARDVFEKSYNKIKKAQEKLLNAFPFDKNKRSTLSLPLDISSNMSQQDYENAVKKAIEYIYAGDIFQVVPAQRFSFDFDLSSFDLYRSLRRLNPSPFLFHLDFGDGALVGSSPEIMARVRDNTVTVRPIAGTRKRGKTTEEDKALAKELLSDPKERAEHLMLLDLGRNDVGRVAKTGTVNVTDDFFIEYYSHVMHIVSNVEGTLDPALDSLDALFAGFPAGTVSGAPKIRAMEIIDELEPERRSYYGGCVGYLDGNGNVDTCIALRTALVKDNKVYVQAGAGVVADSDPTKEYEETCNKARALVSAAEDAVLLTKKN